MVIDTGVGLEDGVGELTGEALGEGLAVCDGLGEGEGFKEGLGAGLGGVGEGLRVDFDVGPLDVKMMELVRSGALLSEAVVVPSEPF